MEIIVAWVIQLCLTVNLSLRYMQIYADYVCLMANSKKDMKLIMEKVNECVIEYGLKDNEKKSKVVCINGEVRRT